LNPILVIKTAALGDVLRTTSILPGLHERYEEAAITWLTAPGAVDLLRTHPMIQRIDTVDSGSVPGVDAAVARLASTHWSRVISLDDEPLLARIATRVPSRRLTGMYERADGAIRYTPDSAPWNDMGLLSVYGKEAADRLKVQNEVSHPRLLADFLGIRPGAPELHLPAASLGFGRAFSERTGLRQRKLVIGLNAGAGGRWEGKQLPVDRSVELLAAIDRDRGGEVSFLVLGGPSEEARNREILAGLARDSSGVRAIDAGTSNGLLDFAALVGQCDLVISSDSLALHLCIALGVRVVAFFAPTSAAEIELYGRGEKVRSTAPDYCSYTREADNRTITVERLLEAVRRQVAEHHESGTFEGRAPSEPGTPS
jgi:heptosyltransferase-2